MSLLASSPHALYRVYDEDEFLAGAAVPPGGTVTGPSGARLGAVALAAACAAIAIWVALDAAGHSLRAPRAVGPPAPAESQRTVAAGTATVHLFTLRRPGVSLQARRRPAPLRPAARRRVRRPPARNVPSAPRPRRAQADAVAASPPVLSPPRGVGGPPPALAAAPSRVIAPHPPTGPRTDSSAAQFGFERSPG